MLERTLDRHGIAAPALPWECAVLRARRESKPTVRETPYEAMPAAQALGSGR